MLHHKHNYFLSLRLLTSLYIYTYIFMINDKWNTYIYTYIDAHKQGTFFPKSGHFLQNEGTSLLSWDYNKNNNNSYYSSMLLFLKKERGELPPPPFPLVPRLEIWLFQLIDRKSFITPEPQFIFKLNFTQTHQFSLTL